jgi:hypothetical protein
MPKLLLTLLDGHNAKIRMLAVYTPASGCSSRTSASLPVPGGVQSGCSRVGNAIAGQRFLRVWNISHLIINVYTTWKYWLIEREESQVQLAGCKTKWKVRYLLFRLSCILECSNLNLFSCVLGCELILSYTISDFLNTGSNLLSFLPTLENHIGNSAFCHATSVRIINEATYPCIVIFFIVAKPKY